MLGLVRAEGRGGTRTMFTVLITAMFAWLFVRALSAFLRSRDPLQRAVTLVFSAMALLFALALWEQLVAPPPAPLGAVAAVLLLGQPFLTLRLVAHVRRVPGWVQLLALTGWLATSIPLALLESGPPAVVLAAVGVFVVTETVSAALLAMEARHRSGSPRVRLNLAAGATALFAFAILSAGAGAADDRTASATTNVARVAALISAAGYLMAFVPAAWLRRLWSARTAHEMIRRLLAAPPDEPPHETWARYATAVCEVTGADAALVLLDGPDGEQVEVAAVGLPHATGSVRTSGVAVRPVRISAVATRPVDVRTDPAPNWAKAIGARSGARFVTSVALPVPGGRLVLAGRYRGLFDEDDTTLFAELAVQTATLAERGAVLVERARLVGAVQTASRAKTDFLAHMSHELRTPLTAIIGFTELMGDEELVGDRRLVPQKWISTVHASSRHLLGLINDILDLAKVESGSMELNVEAVDTVAAVNEAVASLQPLIARKRLRMTVAVPPLTVLADRIRFRQIIYNLLSNAIKFTPEEGAIFVAGGRYHGEIQLSVTDTGPGIADADRTRIFEDFQQVGDFQSRAAGTGLGLALTRRLIEAHGGMIELHSQLGHGSRFVVTLPGAAMPAPVSPPPSIPTALPAGRGGVLVVEDDPHAASLLGTYLNGSGYQMSVANSGEEALAAAAANPPDVILLDLVLPGIDGWEVLRRVKADEQLRHIPVVIISVADEQEVSLALGAVDYFVKPVDRDALVGWLTRHGLVPPLHAGDSNVLVIDDDPATLTIVEHSLSQEGLRVVTASSGSHGLALARRHTFDLIICDLVMPDVDGFSVIAALHDDPATSGIPVLVLTGHDVSESDRRRLNGKVIGVLTKENTGSDELRAWLDGLTGAVTRPVRAGPRDAP